MNDRVREYMRKHATSVAGIVTGIGLLASLYFGLRPEKPNNYYNRPPIIELPQALVLWEGVGLTQRVYDPENGEFNCKVEPPEVATFNKKSKTLELQPLSSGEYGYNIRCEDEAGRVLERDGTIFVLRLENLKPDDIPPDDILEASVRGFFFIPEKPDEQKTP